MNIQIYGKAKCFGTKSAERFFKERKIKYQLIDITSKGMSSREIDGVLASVKNIRLLVDEKSSWIEESGYHRMTSVDNIKQCLVKYPEIFASPIVRDCESKKATVGNDITTWKEWIKNNK